MTWAHSYVWQLQLGSSPAEQLSPGLGVRNLALLLVQNLSGSEACTPVPPPATHSASQNGHSRPPKCPAVRVCHPPRPLAFGLLSLQTHFLTLGSTQANKRQKYISEPSLSRGIEVLRA